jgi:hypothetical protein
MIGLMIFKTIQLFTDNQGTHIVFFVIALLMLLSWMWQEVNPDRNQNYSIH